MHVGGDLTFTVMDGATLTMPQDLVIGRSGAGTFNMMGGTINIGRDFEFGFSDLANCVMTGGTIIVTRDVEMPKTGEEQTVHLDLHGGTLIVNGNLLMREGATMDITTGMLILDGDELATVQGYIDNGWISAYEGDGTIEKDYDVTNPGQTTVKALHKLNPNPVIGSVVAAGQIELSWTLPDPCVAGQPVNVDVYFTDDWEALYSFTDPVAIRVVNNENVTSVVVQTQLYTQYYWAVDAYVGDDNDPIVGPIFSFLTDNIPPKVDVGDDLTTWLVDGVMTTNLDATVTDDGALSPYTVQWTVISEPNDPNSPDAVITDPSAEDASITLSALGEYVLQLEAFDGEHKVADTLTINVFSDHCEAAKSLPGWTPSTADINLDCIVDQLDLDILTENWLKCNALDCTDPEHDHVE
jgi:formylmethanofuran dehydrogenase subunit C